jgi:glycosyltransferase involved in cell wall biosynthesis
MKLVFVVQRYGVEVLGGSELLARQYATRLAAVGHTVEVLTSCATSYIEWANVYPEGDEESEGVLIHRLPTQRPRILGPFSDIAARIDAAPRLVPYHLQREWMRQQGPFMPGVGAWLAGNSERFDAVVFITYLYYTTWAGLPASRRPSILIPTAHDEPALLLPLFDGVFQMADGLGFLTEEEAQLVNQRFGDGRPSGVIGAGIELESGGDAAWFRNRFGLDRKPYIVYAGRIDANKGATELHHYFRIYKQRRRTSLKLVMIGEDVARLPDHPDVIKTGFVDRSTKDAGLKGALVLVQPSYFESFSFVLMEGWAAGLPALVQSRCAVTAGQSRRSRGGLPYSGYPEFEAALDLLLERAELRQALGQAGREYVAERFSWGTVLERFTDLVTAVVDRS